MAGKRLNFTFKFGDSSIKIDHAVFKVLAEAADVEVFGIVGRLVLLDVPLAERSRQDYTTVGECGSLSWVLSPGTLHEIVQFGSTIWWDVRPGTVRHIPDDFAAGQIRVRCTA
jgi:hypothetical protein